MLFSGLLEPVIMDQSDALDCAHLTMSCVGSCERYGQHFVEGEPIPRPITEVRESEALRVEFNLPISQGICLPSLVNFRVPPRGIIFARMRSSDKSKCAYMRAEFNLGYYYNVSPSRQLLVTPWKG